MDFIDLAAQQRRIKEILDKNIQRVLDHGMYIMGPEVKELETRLASYVGVKHTVSCASGTDALLMALMAYGVGPGDAIFTTPFTFIATAEVIALLGATPVFVDIDPRTFNISPSQLAIAIEALKTRDASLYPLPKSSTPEKELVPKGIIAVDLFGLPADYDKIESIARENGLFVIEDAAQSFGAKYRDKMSCSFGNVACTSFFPAKPLGCYGDGGMCFTDDDELAAIMESIRVHGKGNHKYDNIRIGINGRLDTIQAAILLAKFDIFPNEVFLRENVAAQYTDLFSDKPYLTTPFEPEGSGSVWAQYSVLAENEDRRKVMMQMLQESNIPTAIYYPIPLHRQKAFSYLKYQEGTFAASEDISKRIFSLPMHPYLSKDAQRRVAEVLRNQES